MTLKEIAKEAGTSISTVSRVLNQTSKTCASKELQDRIWKIARESGYLPNEAARTLQKSGTAPVDKQEETIHSDREVGENRNKTRKSDIKVGEITFNADSLRGDVDRKRHITVSVILARTENLKAEPFFEELFQCLEAELFKQRVIIGDVIYEKDMQKEDLSSVDGIVILGRCSKELLEYVLSRNRNVVGVWRNPLDFNVDEVVCDGKKAAEMAVDYLLSLGHEKIAYIGGCSYERRYIGYCDVLFRNNIPLHYDLIKQTDHTAAEAEKAFLELLEQKKKGESEFSAVFCANDVTAIRVLELLGENKKYFMKESVSVISIDDIEEAQNTKPYLTTVRMPRQEMAHMAVLILLDRIQGGHEEIVRNEFPCRIVRRASCFPCKINGQSAK